MGADSTKHIPVMLDEAIDVLKLKKGMIVFDATLGGGGYTREIYKRIMPGGRLIACDRDFEAIEMFKKNYPDIAENINLVHSNYSHIRKILKDFDLSSVDAVVADLGLSSDQLAQTNRGFSFAQDVKLDMRMNLDNDLTAHNIVNELSQDELAKILFDYGDEKFAGKIAREICSARSVETVSELVGIVEKSVPMAVQRKSKIHPATKTFQAIRIAVNQEFEHLKVFLTEGIEVLGKGGIFSVVSFHSGEDRLVKNIFRANARGCICAPDMPICVCGHKPKVRILTKKPVMPKEEEINKNPRSRSARLRAVEKI